MTYGWEGKGFDEVALVCQRRDPRRFGYGLATAGPGAAPVLQWFRDPVELVAFLWRLEPQRWGLRLAALAEFKARVEPPVVASSVEGLTEAVRAGFNELAAPHFQVLWWGTFEELLAGGDAVTDALHQAFSRARPGVALGPDSLAEYLRAHLPT